MGGGPIFFLHGYSNSCRVATLFPPNSDYKILEKYSDINGRLLLLKCKCEEAINVIVNCYAPTQLFKKDQIVFINFIKSHINNIDTENIIMEGDFNFYMDPKLDKQKTMTSRDNNQAYRQDIIALLVSLNLADSWRIQNLKSK